MILFEAKAGLPQMVCCLFPTSRPVVRRPRWWGTGDDPLRNLVSEYLGPHHPDMLGRRRSTPGISLLIPLYLLYSANAELGCHLHQPTLSICAYSPSTYSISIAVSSGAVLFRNISHPSYPRIIPTSRQRCAPEYLTRSSMARRSWAQMSPLPMRLHSSRREMWRKAGPSPS
jgi:hypothetical protein